MEVDMNISDILREVIGFLECLRDAQLPLAQESLREKLLTLSKNSLATIARVSPEPYLDMNSGPKSLLLTKNEADSEEYVGIEESQKQIHQDYYETFENESQTAAERVANELPGRNDDQHESERLIEIYKNLSAVQIKSKCHKCGPLHRKEGKKLFLSESRACWIALVGSHLLIYRSEKHNRPYAVYSLCGYMARPAPNLIPRDRQKSESAFEMYSPGNETLQFIARTPKDMDQWITKVCEVGCSNENARNVAEIRKKKRIAAAAAAAAAAESSPTNRRKDETRRRRDTEKSSNADKLTQAEMISKKVEAEPKNTPLENPPPLPARIPRRLPSLPSDNTITLVFKPSAEDDDDDEDDIYHKIEDLKNGMCYQNMVLLKKQRANANASDEKHEITYDDIRLSKKRNKERPEEEKSRCDTRTSLEETYDDIVTLSRLENATASVESQIRKSDRSIADDEERREEVYDDVESLTLNGRFAKDRVKNQLETSKFLQKKSFLDRVLSRKESPGKSDKRYKGKVSSSPSPASVTEVMPTYDDVSDLTMNQEPLADEKEELPEYNCPPPPRPIYNTKSSNNPDFEQLYDDVNAYREQHNESHQQTILQSTQESKAEAKESRSDNSSTEEKDEPSQEELEHYQSPKSDLRIPDVEIQPEEELYDDIALWAARQRDDAGKKDGENAKSIINSDKKSWFAVNKKSRASDSSCSEMNRRNSECEEIEDSSESNGVIKRNTFQKLIGKFSR